MWQLRESMFIYLLSVYLFNDVVSSPDCIALNVRMTNEWKFVKCLEGISRGLCWGNRLDFLGRTEENHDKFRLASPGGRDLSLGPTKCLAAVRTTQALRWTVLAVSRILLQLWLCVAFPSPWLTFSCHLAYCTGNSYVGDTINLASPLYASVLSQWLLTYYTLIIGPRYSSVTVKQVNKCLYKMSLNSVSKSVQRHSVVRTI
jgi:hypothetical protein